MITVRQALRAAAQQLRRAGIPEPRQDAEYLLAELLGFDRGVLVARGDDPLAPALESRFDEWIGRRLAREPCQHIVGTQEFYGLEFRVDRRVLIPRAETEGLVDAVLELDLPQRAKVVDLGTGSGCIAVALAIERRDLDLYALDVSQAALSLARENLARHGLEDRIELIQADLATPPDDWRGRMDVVVSNPPYISACEWHSLEPEVRDYDPRSALVPGPTGLEAYELLGCSAYKLLRPEGTLVLELGAGQGEAVRELLATNGFRAIQIRPDLQGIPRVLVAERP